MLPQISNQPRLRLRLFVSALYRGAFIKVWHWFDNLLVGMGAEDHSMRAVTEYRNRAQECRKLATMVHKLEDKYALDCAAQSWERLADRRERDIGAEDQ